jgi:hypothetical protein
MYQQSQDVRNINDAHSPLLAMAMSLTREIAPGPAILFVAQLGCWGLGLWLLSDALILAGRKGAGVAVVLACLTPLLCYIFVDVNKDAAMAALGMILVGWLTRIALTGWRPTFYSWLGLVLLTLAFVGMRHNGFIALAPLLLAFVLLQWPGLQRAWLRGLLVTLAALLAIVATDHWVKYEVIGATRFWGARQLVMFDLAGITRYSGDDVSGGVMGPNFKAQAWACYTPRWHDPFEWGPCRASGAALANLAKTEPGRRTMFAVWRKAVLTHPVSYVRHRLAHYNQVMRIACTDCATAMTGGGVAPRPWEAAPRRVTGLEIRLESLAGKMYASDLARGAVWLLVLMADICVLGILWLRGIERRMAILALGVAGSALAYAGAFLAIGIAYQARYLHWTITLGAIALAMTASAVFRHQRDEEKAALPRKGGPVMLDQEPETQSTT